MAKLSSTQIHGMLTINGKVAIDSESIKTSYSGGFVEEKSLQDMKIWSGSETEYNNLSTKDPNTLYFVEED